MGCIVNGLSLHGGLLPFGATFLVFADFMRPAIRMAALMGIGSHFVFTHDSIFVGEDGPTHQPVEQAKTGGPSGGCISAEFLDTPIDYDSLTSLNKVVVAKNHSSFP